VWRIVEIKYEKNILSSINKWLYTYKKKREISESISHTKKKKKLTPKTLFLILSNTHHHLINAKALFKKIR
jgi:hypothetical protein